MLPGDIRIFFLGQKINYWHILFLVFTEKHSLCLLWVWYKYWLCVGFRLRRQRTSESVFVAPSASRAVPRNASCLYHCLCVNCHKKAQTCYVCFLLQELMKKSCKIWCLAGAPKKTDWKTYLNVPDNWKPKRRFRDTCVIFNCKLQIKRLRKQTLYTSKRKKNKKEDVPHNGLSASLN